MTDAHVLDLTSDHHVHSTFSSDASSTLAENVAEAAQMGLSTIRIVDHVRAATPWVPQFLQAVADLDVPDGLTVLTGVEAEILDTAGRLDVPADVVAGRGGLDRIVIADHQFPGPDGPWSPWAARDRLARGLSADDALEMLVTATVRAMRSAGRCQLAHLFSILPKIGLSEVDLGPDHLAAIASVAAMTDTVIEVSEKWMCPGEAAVRAFMAAGVPLVAASDSHHKDGVGRFGFVERVADSMELAYVG
jgi:putative hydrolase